MNAGLGAPPLWWPWLCRLEPALDGLHAAQRERLVAALRAAPFDGAERTALVAGLVIVTWLTQAVAPVEFAARLAQWFWQYGSALLLLGLWLGVLHLRRLRRVARDFLVKEARR